MSAGVLGLIVVLDLSLIAVTATVLLGGRSWSKAAPRLAIVLWQACGLSVLLAFVAVISIALLPADEAGSNLSITSCLSLLLHRLSRAHLLTPTVLLAVGAAVALARAALVLARGARAGARVRRQQRDGLDLLHAGAKRTEAHVLEVSRPLAYSVAGDGGRVVVSSGAMALLDPAEVAAVVAHEQAHLRGRHHLVLLAGRAARDLLPHSRWLSRAHAELAELLELAADDAAAQATGAAPVARAVTVLGGSAQRPQVATRVHRLVGGGRRLATLPRVALAALAALLIVLPASAVVAPVAAAHEAHHQS